MQSQPATVSTTGELYSYIGSMEPTRLSLSYRAGLIVVTIAMMLLPLVYIALIALTAAATWWHLTSNVGMLGGSGFQWKLIGYLGPAVVGAVVTFFMVKPLLARRDTGPAPIVLDPAQEPGLFAFVHGICEQVGAALPARVQVDCQVNASAGFLRGALRRELVLTIGLPLAAGLSIRELGGVLAHEFGHFAQGGGMRLTAIVRGINGWFARVVYERDAWDESLEQYSKEADWRLAAVLGVARLAVWLSRRVLHGLMLAGHAISCFMMRQMEYDADSYEVKLSGVDTFTRTSVRLRELGIASQLAYRDLRDGLHAGAIPGDMPSYVASSVSRVPPAVLERVRSMPEDKTGTFDTHPADADRVRAAQRIGASGVLAGGEAPASQLFSSFDAVCAAVTRHHYEHELGIDATSLTLVSAEAAAADTSERQSRREAIDTLFQECLSIVRPLRIPAAPTLPPDEQLLALRAATARGTAAAHESLVRAYRQLEALERQRRDTFTVDTLRGCGFTVDAESLGLSTHTNDEGLNPGAEATLSQQVQAFEDAITERLSRAVALQADAASVPSGAGSRGSALLVAFNAVAAVVPATVELRRMMPALELLQANSERAPDAYKLRQGVERLERVSMTKLRLMHDTLAAVPPDVLPGVRNLATFCGLSPDTGSEEASAIVERVWALYFDLLGRLATMARAVEHAEAAAS